MKTALSFISPAGCALSMAITLFGAGARAQAPDGASSAVAEALFQEGRELFKRQQYAEACPKLEESQRLEPKLGTLLNLALCNEKVGKVATAWAQYTSAAAIARRDGQREREDFAREQVELLGKRLARVIIKVEAPPAGLTIALDERSLDRAVLNTPLPIDPGQHRFSARAPGKKEWFTEINVPPGPAEIPLELPALEDAEATPAPQPAQPAAAPPPVQPAVVPPPGPRPPAPSPPAPSRTGPVLVYTGFGVGAVGLVVGVVTGAVTLAKSGAIVDGCGETRCPTDQHDALSTATTLANVSNVGFALGAVGVGVGIVGLVMSGQPDAKGGASVAAVFGPGRIGLHGKF